MLRRGNIPDIRAGRLTREKGYLVVTMRHYPRFVRRDQRDEYIHVMAPDLTLFAEFKYQERTLNNHNLAFENVRYESRFYLTTEAMDHLARLTQMAEKRDVYVVCQCIESKRCHTDLLLMTARHLGAAWCEAPRFDYPVWAARLAAGDSSFVLH